MPDPLSISTGVLAFLQVTGNVVWQLKKFHDGASVVNQAIADLSNGVAGLQRVLLAMRDAFEHVTAQSDTGSTGHVASLWNNVARAVVEGKDIVDQLHEFINEIDRDTTHLNDYRKQLRFKSAESRIAGFRHHVDSYRDGLQLSMQTLILVNQITQSRIGQDKPDLTELRRDMRSIAMDMTSRIENLTAMVQTSKDDAHLAAMKSLQECVRSAASTISSASTILTLAAEDDLDSALGDLFPAEDNPAIRRWMRADAVVDFEDPSLGLQRPQSVADVLSFKDADSDDSDDELQDEITRILCQKGKDKLRAGEHMSAEKLLYNCLTRLKTARARAHPSHSQLHLDTIQSLYEIYYIQQRWDRCQKVILQRMSLQELRIGRRDPGYLTDVIELARLLNRQEDYAGAKLHATTALKGYWRLKHTEGAEECLDLLVSISDADSNEDDKEAYSVMLDTLTAGMAWPTSRSALNDAPTTSTGDAPDDGRRDFTGSHSAKSYPFTLAEESASSAFSSSAEMIHSTPKVGSIRSETPASQSSATTIHHSNRPSADYASGPDVVEKTGSLVQPPTHDPVEDGQSESTKPDQFKIGATLINPDWDHWLDMVQLYLKEDCPRPSFTPSSSQIDGAGLYPDEYSRQPILLEKQLSRLRENGEPRTKSGLWWRNRILEQWQALLPENSDPLRRAEDSMKIVCDGVWPQVQTDVHRRYCLEHRQHETASWGFWHIPWKWPQPQPEFVASSNSAQPVSSPPTPRSSLLADTSSMEVPDFAVITGDTGNELVVVRNIVVLGDPLAGKTQLINRFANNVFSDDWTEHFSYTTVVNITVSTTLVKVRILDMGGDTKVKPNSAIASMLDAFTVPFLLLVCFAMHDPDSLENVTHWIPEILRRYPKSPRILVGTKFDLILEQSNYGGTVSRINSRAEEIREQIGASAYLKCSALTGAGVTELFESAARVVLNEKKQRGRWGGRSLGQLITQRPRLVSTYFSTAMASQGGGPAPTTSSYSSSIDRGMKR